MQFSSAFLEGVADYVDPGLPFISLSKGLELNTLRMMAQIIPQALRNPRQPVVALSGPSFALELMNKLPTGDVDIANYTCRPCFHNYMYNGLKVNNFCFLVLFSHNSNGGRIERQKIGKYSPTATSFKSFKNQHIKVNDLQ